MNVPANKAVNFSPSYVTGKFHKFCAEFHLPLLIMKRKNKRKIKEEADLFHKPLH